MKGLQLRLKLRRPKLTKRVKLEPKSIKILGIKTEFHVSWPKIRTNNLTVIFDFVSGIIYKS
jgi:hypothetical protein